MSEEQVSASEEVKQENSEEQKSETQIQQTGIDLGSTAASMLELNQNRGDVKASTVARMMGLMTVSDLKLFESKIDLMSTKVNNLVIRLERLTAQVESLPGGNEFERIEAQLASMRTLLKEFMGVSYDHTRGTEAAKHRRERAVMSTSTQDVRDKADDVLEHSADSKSE
ncbi:MAG: hypothetical protein KDD56_01500 [Bdellovibrionales bacterium]|nr:hypothetical protein [Bdellovibrionales bacterium]